MRIKIFFFCLLVFYKHAYAIKIDLSNEQDDFFKNVELPRIEEKDLWLITTPQKFQSRYQYRYIPLKVIRRKRFVPVYCPPYRQRLTDVVTTIPAVYNGDSLPDLLKVKPWIKKVSWDITAQSLCKQEKKVKGRSRPLLAWIPVSKLSLDFEIFYTGGSHFLEESYPYGKDWVVAVLKNMQQDKKFLEDARKAIDKFSLQYDEYLNYKNLLFAGDMMFSRGNARYYRNKAKVYPFQKILHWLKTADYVSANLETSLSTRGKKHMPFKGIYFRDDPSWAKGLKEARIRFITLANNHSLDYGKDAFQDTIDVLHKEGLLPFGFILPKETYQKAACENGFCFLGYNFVPPWEYRLTNGGPGVPWPFAQNIARDIAKNKHQFMVVQLHGNKEYQMYPTVKKYRFARDAIDSGADLFIGHHPHWIQGWERYRGKLIFYSLGNFIFDQYWSEMTQYGILARVFVEDNTIIGYIVHPFKIRLGQPSPLYQQEKSFLSPKLIQMCSPEKIRKNLQKDIYKMPPLKKSESD